MVCVCRKHLSSPRCRSELIDSALVVIVPGQKCMKKERKKKKIIVYYIYIYLRVVIVISKLTFIRNILPTDTLNIEDKANIIS